MTTLNITTDKTRAQMITELTNWASGTKVGGSDRVWACSDSIFVNANIEIYGLTLIFSSAKYIRANASATINVSSLVRGEYSESAIIYLKHSKGSAIGLVAGTGKWIGSGVTFLLDTGNIVFSSSTSDTVLLDTILIAAGGTDPYINITLSGNSNFNLQRSSGVTLRLYGGNLSMNPKGIGAVSGRGFASIKLLANNPTFYGFIMNATAAFPIQTASTSFTANTMTFIDGKIDPVLIHGYPANNSGVVRILKRTITLLPVTTTRAPVSAFKYRVSSNRVLEPASTTTNNFTIVTNQSGNTNDTYLLTVFRGAGTSNTGATYKSLTNLTIDKDMRVQYRKYGLKESSFSSNSYDFAVDAKSTMLADTFIHSATPILASTTTASQFYDGVRSLVANNYAFPEDLLTTDGETLTIKTGWTLDYDAVNTNLSVSTSANKIFLGKDSYIGKNFNYSKIVGSVASSMSTHTNLTFTRADGKANLNLQITCPPGSSDPVAGVWLFSQGLDNRAGMITGQTTGTGITNISLQVSATAKYYCTAKALGSNQFAPFIIEPVGGLGTSKELTLLVYEKNDGTPLLPTTLTPAQTAVADTLVFHNTHVEITIPSGFATNPRWSSTDKIWQYKAEDFIPIAYKLDVIQTALIMAGRNQLMFFQEGRILISAATNAKVLEQDPDNKTTVSSTTNVKVSLTTISMGRIGDTDARNTFIDNENGAIDVRGGVPINGGFSIADANRLVAIKADTNGIGGVKTVVDANKVLATAIKNDTGTIKNDTGLIKTKADETHQRLALDSTKPLTNKPDGGITSTGINIVATELGDGSIKQTRS